MAAALTEGALLLIDAVEHITAQDTHIAGMVLEEHKSAVIVVNKWDLIKGDTYKRELLDRALERQLKFISFAPRINLSALTGERVMNLFGKIDLVFEQFSRRVSTPAINKALKRMVEKHPPPRIRKMLTMK